MGVKPSCRGVSCVLYVRVCVCVTENRRPVDNAPGTAETAREVCQRQEFLAQFDESETGS